MKPPRSCIEHRCPNLAYDGPRCEKHRLEFVRKRKGWATGQRGSNLRIPEPLRRRALAKARRCCEKCGRTEKQEKELTGKGLHVHHKDGDPRNNDPANHEVLCADCHQDHHRAEDALATRRAARFPTVGTERAQKSPHAHFGQVPWNTAE